VERTATELAKLSPKDAAGYREFRRAFERIGKVLGPILRTTPPSIDRPTAGDAIAFLKVGKNFRGLGKRDAYRLLRWGPMAVADLVSEFFETDLLRAAIAARGIYGSFAGPWSAGTALPLLLQAAVDGQALAPSQTVRGGLGALSDAIASAAKSFGAEVRTGAPVASILVRENRAVGVVLESGEEILAKAVVSNADPKRTFLELVDPGDIDPDFAGKISNYRMAGVTAKVNYALSGLPAFHAPAHVTKIAPSAGGSSADPAWSPRSRSETGSAAKQAIVRLSGRDRAAVSEWDRPRVDPSRCNPRSRTRSSESAAGACRASSARPFQSGADRETREPSPRSDRAIRRRRATESRRRPSSNKADRRRQ
jgi:phytoene dehydrogenase-like protein